MASCEENAKFDYIPTPSAHPDGMAFPICEIWPASPPRKNFFAEDEMLCHPLVSPLGARDWSGAPPMWICTVQVRNYSQTRISTLQLKQRDKAWLYSSRNGKACLIVLPW
jgi:acetyl esterase/lipase